MCLSFRRHVQLYTLLPYLVRHRSNLEWLDQLKAFNHLWNCVLGSVVYHDGMGRLVRIPRAKELVVAIFVRHSFFLVFCPWIAFHWLVYLLYLVGVNYLLFLHVFCASY